ncbi:MAG: hypothetical protein Q9216_005577 [Gyalolechia sp. 2 TL-2023]
MVNNTSANDIKNHPHNYYDNPPSTAWMASVADSIGLGLVTLVLIARCYTKTNVLKTYFYIIGVTFAKISLLLFLYRIFSVDRKFRIASWTIGVVLTLWSVISLLLKIFACRPVKASFDLHLYLLPSTVCPIKAYEITNWHGLCNILTDFAILILPIPMVWKLHVTARKKIGLAAVFATGIFICTVGIVRQYILYNTEKNGDNYYSTRIKVWMSLEFSFSIIVACLPTLTPLIKRLSILSTWIPTLRSRILRSSTLNPSHPSSHSKGVIKISGPVEDHDIERNALRSDGHPPGTWQTPSSSSAWKEAGGGPKRGWDDDYSKMEDTDLDDGGTTMRSESDVTLQDLQPVSTEGGGAVVGKKEQQQGLREFVVGELRRGGEKRG